MRLIELTYYAEPFADAFGNKIAINPEYVKSVSACADRWVAICMEGWTQPLYAELSYDRLIADLQR